MRIRTSIVGLPFPYHGWLEQPFHKNIWWDGVMFSADAGKDIRRLIVFSNHMVEFEPLELSLHFENGITVSRHFRVLGIKVSIYLRYCEI